MIQRMAKQLGTFLCNLSPLLEKVIPDSALTKQGVIRRRIFQVTNQRESAEQISKVICGGIADGSPLNHQINFHHVGKKLLKEFPCNSVEMVNYYQLLINNNRDDIIVPLAYENLKSSKSVSKTFSTLTKTTLLPHEIANLFVTSVPYKQYKEHIPVMAEFLEPHTAEVKNLFFNATDDSLRFIWASILVNDVSNRDSIIEHLATLPFDQNCNYSLSLLDDKSFTEIVLTQKIKAWLESRQLDKKGKILEILKSGDYSITISDSLTKQLYPQFYGFFIKGLTLRNDSLFIKNLIAVAVTIDPQKTLIKLTSPSIITYVGEKVIPLARAIHYFVTDHKEKYLPALLDVHFDESMELIFQDTKLCKLAISSLWKYDSPRAFSRIIAFIQSSPADIDPTIMDVLKGYEDGIEEMKNLLNSRTILLREIAITLLRSLKSDVSKLFEERLLIEKNSSIKALLEDALQPPVPPTPVSVIPVTDLSRTGPTTNVVELIMVTINNNNKYYRMMNNGATFSVEWGRVGGNSQKATYPISEWDKKYREKINKGYVDNSKLFLKKSKTIEYADIDDRIVQKLIDELMSYSNKMIFENYTVTAENVTRQQINAAQQILDNLIKETKVNGNVKFLNESLLQLYQVIPRKMKNVNENLYSKDSITKNDLHDLIVLVSSEQDKLDAMSSKLRLIEIDDEQNSSDDQQVKKLTLLDVMGLTIRQVNRSEEMQIKGLMKESATKYRRAYAVENSLTQKKFSDHVSKSKDPRTELYFHGSRNENFITILQTGLLIRPSGAVYTGSMFGDGIYFADKAQKSIGYTSLQGSYWTNGTATRGFLALFSVHVGKALPIKHHESWCTQINARLLESKGGYDSVFAKGGADLRNNEMIVYNSNQCTVKFLIDLG